MKKSKKTSRRTIFLASIASCLALACLIVHTLYPYLGINFLLYTLPSFSAATQAQALYGENIDMSQILPTSQHYVVNSKGKDLIDVAADLGINLIRITNVTKSFNNNMDALYTRAQWRQVLNKMQSKGIKALILIEIASDNSNYYAPDIRPAYLHLVQEYLDSGVFSNPDVYAVDIKNEPVLTNANISMLQTAHALIKAKYPDLKQTIGWWATPTSPKDPYNPNIYSWSDYATGQKINSIVDFYSIHIYGLATHKFGITLSPSLKIKAFISQVQNGLQTKKPILIEEFGEANGGTVTDQDTIGNPVLQADVYQGVYQALKEMHSDQIIGAVAFDFYSRDQYPDAWAIIQNKGDYLLPAAYILQEYALGKNKPALQVATVDTSQSYLVKNDDNHMIKNLHVSDRIGLKLQLDTSKEHSLSLNANGILQRIQALYYYPVAHSYYAMYQARSRGSVQLTITSDNMCATKICATSVYTLTINVQ